MSLKLVYAGSDNGANCWPCPHGKELCTTCKHCLSGTSCPASRAWRVSFGMEKSNGNLQPSYPSCIKVRAFLTQALAQMVWSSVCATWFKDILQQKAIQNSDGKHRKGRAWSVILSQLMETCCQLSQYFPLIWDSNGGQCSFITSVGLKCHQRLFISAVYLMQLRAVALAAWQCKTKRDSVWSNVLFTYLWPDSFCYPCTVVLFVTVGQRCARVHQESLKKPQWKLED